MASTVPIMPFLRPLGLPRPSTIRHFLRFSTAIQCRAEAQAASSQIKQEDPNLVASRRASPTYPPKTLKSLPRPKESRASRRTKHPRPERAYPTRHPTHHPASNHKLIPDPVEPLSPAECAPNLPYFITRTGSNELPVYLDMKAGGTKKLTLIRKINGKAEVLRDELRVRLGLGEKEAWVNPVNRHVLLKGHHKSVVERHLRERMF